MENLRKKLPGPFGCLATGAWGDTHEVRFTGSRVPPPGSILPKSHFSPKPFFTKAIFENAERGREPRLPRKGVRPHVSWRGKALAPHWFKSSIRHSRRRAAPANARTRRRGRSTSLIHDVPSWIKAPLDQSRGRQRLNSSSLPIGMSALVQPKKPCRPGWPA